MSASVQFLKKALLAAELGIQVWRPMSTGEKVSVALALNRQDWLLDMGYSIPEAIDRAGDWVPLVPYVAREVSERRQPHWRGLR
jgi:hypothetical protein